MSITVKGGKPAQDLRKEVVAFICAEIDRILPAPLPLNDETDITTDLSLDSVAIMDMVFALEERYDISISLNDLADTYKIGQLADLVCKIKGAHD